jgi:hypothetical protein
MPLVSGFASRASHRALREMRVFSKDSVNSVAEIHSLDILVLGNYQNGLYRF